MTDQEMVTRIENSKRVLLVEPPYRRKYPPLGLAKIATKAKQSGAEVEFVRKLGGGSFDLICITTLFTFESQKVLDTICEIQTFHPDTPIVVGGIYASLMTDHLIANTEGVDVFQGYSNELDQCVPDYTIDWEVKKPWHEFSYVFTTRGCPNRCPYCAVHKLEPDIWINPTWKDHILEDRRNVMISDNNLSAQPEEHLGSVIDFLVEKKKKVVFDNGFDCKHMTVDKAKELARLKYVRSGMRLAFDRIEEDGVFQEAVERLKTAGIAKGNIMAYVLFNFNETPREANYRMRVCADLGIRPYPQQFQKLTQVDKKNKYLGKYWTVPLLRSFRYFWLMMGYFTKMTFDEFIQRPEEAEKLGPEDLAAWNREWKR